MNKQGERGRGAVLVGVADATLGGRLAEHLDGAGFMPCLAFKPDQVVVALECHRFAALVIHRSLLSRELLSFARLGPGGSDLPVVALSSLAQPPHAPGGGVALELPESALDEVVAGVSALARESDPKEGPTTVTWGPLALDLSRRQASWHGTDLRLTPTQLRIMEVLVGAAGGCVTTHDLSTRLWGQVVFNDAERMEAHIRRIRNKLDPERMRPKFLLTVRGEGYRLADDDIAPPTIDLAELETLDV